jgi:hypothetical protein
VHNIAEGLDRRVGGMGELRSYPEYYVVRGCVAKRLRNKYLYGAICTCLVCGANLVRNELACPVSRAGSANTKYWCGKCKTKHTVTPELNLFVYFIMRHIMQMSDLVFSEFAMPTAAAAAADDDDDDDDDREGNVPASGARTSTSSSSSSSSSSAPSSSFVAPSTRSGLFDPGSFCRMDPRMDKVVRGINKWCLQHINDERNLSVVVEKLQWFSSLPEVCREIQSDSNKIMAMTDEAKLRYLRSISLFRKLSAFLIQITTKSHLEGGMGSTSEGGGSGGARGGGGMGGGGGGAHGGGRGGGKGEGGARGGGGGPSFSTGFPSRKGK